jgi:ABC-type transport system involved in cytochrome c biogenesis permease subunit
MAFGFVFITGGIVTGAIWAFVESAPAWVDPKMTTALVTWAFCLVMVLLRVTAGWRGRKAAMMALTVVASSAASWAVHYVRQ